MENNNNKYIDIPKEKFEFVNTNEKLIDKKFDTKPISYFKDALIRFRKNKASVVATIIIILIVLFAFIVPICTSTEKAKLMDANYRQKGPRIAWLKNSIGLADGGSTTDLTKQQLIFELAKGIGAAFEEDKEVNLIKDTLDNYYQPVIKIKNVKMVSQGRKQVPSYDTRYDKYLSVGFIYQDVEQSEYQKILEWEKTTGKKVLYPLIEENEYYFGNNDDRGAANYWYKTTGKAIPVSTKSGEVVKLVDDSKNSIDDIYNIQLEENYSRDADGNYKYYKNNGGGNDETSLYRVRILYYNYYQYLNGFEPNYIMGTDSQGYDLAYRLASGIKLSLLLAVCVSVINFVIGAIYGAVEGYYGGAVDIVLERVSDILSGVPFIIVATLFQMHLARKVGTIPCLIFAFVVTGWIGTASRVRTQFYRFKNQEYVMAARTLGASDRRIIWKHIFPNTLGTIITSSALVIPSVIFSESMLSFLGIVNLGGSKATSLGTLLSDASGIWTQFPHLMIFPAIIISLLMICFNLFGNGLRDAFNPTLRGVEE